MNTQLALSTNQFDIYIDQMRWSDGSHFNIGAVITITGILNSGYFNQALNHMVRCNPGLRFRIYESEGKPFQFVAPHQEQQFKLVDFSANCSNPDDVEQLAKRYIENDFNQPFTFGKESSLCSFQLIRLSSKKYLFYSKFHHIIADGWGTSLAFNDLINNYNQIISNVGFEPLERNLIFTDYLQEESAYRQSQNFESDIKYWTQRLENVSPQIFASMHKPQLLGARKAIYIKREHYNRVEAVCKEIQSNPFHFILSIVFIYLSKRYRQNDLVIGLPILNRSKKVYKDTVGLFISMLPFRTEINNNETFTDILTTVRTLLKQDYRHQRLPLGEMKRIANLDLDSENYQNLFDLTLSYEKHDYSEHFEQTETICEPLYSGQQKTPLAIYVREFDNQSDVKIDFDYNLSYLDAETIEEIVTHFQKLFDDALENLEQNLDKPISQLSLIEPEIYWRLTQESLNSTKLLPTSETLVSVFEEIVSKYPQHIAVKCENTKLTYAELNRRANVLAHHLQQLGIKPETRVALCLERSEHMVVAILGVLKAGGTYVPLDLNYPASRLEFILEDSCASLLIIESSSCQLISTNINVLKWESIWGKIQNDANPSSPQVSLHPQHPAYIIYTSGSTGTPKGCVVTHGNVMRLMRSTEPWFGFNAFDVWTLFHSFAFDFSVWELWGALLYGGKVVIVPFWLSRSPEAFRELLTKENVTVLSQTPSAFGQIIRADKTSTGELALRYVIFGGEALNLESLRPWFERHSDQTPRLVNMYGITETTVHVTYRPITFKDLTVNTGSVIGETIPDLRIYLLDENLEPVPTGWTGEIFVAGAGVARGYFNRPGLTAERFIPNPFGKGRLYRSGDLGRWTKDGDLEYLGRIDNQVKIRGFRIELGEIQAPLASHPQLEEAFVTTYGEGEDKRIVAYYVSKQPPSTSELNEYLQSRLPNYMIPTAYISLDAFPLTVNGKINTSSLPKPNFNLSRHSQYVSPQNLQQEHLCTIWSEVLTIEQVGIDDNFFEIGGDSILAMQVVGQAQNQKIQISIKDIYENPTIRQLAALEQVSDVESKFYLAPSVTLLEEEDKKNLPQDVEDAYLISSLQAGMLYHSELHPGSAIFHDIFTFYLRLDHVEDAWQKAITDICQAHLILRTSFDWTKYSTPLQIVHQEVEIPLTIYDLRDKKNAYLEVKQWVELEKSNSFDVRRPPLFRFVIHRLSNSEISLTFSFHHAILDGWSVATLITQLLQRYIQHLKGQYEPLTTLPITYKDFIAQEKQAIANEEMRQFWQQYLSDMELSRVPRSKQTAASRQVERVAVKIDDNIAKALIRVANSAEVPLKTALLAAHLRVLSYITGKTEVITGNVLNGRLENVGSEKLLGLFLNTVPLRMKLAPSSWLSLLKAVFKVENKILPYRNFPLLEIQRVIDKRPLFDVGFNYTHFHVYEGILNLPQVEILNVEDFEETDFPLVAKFALIPGSSSLKLDLVYDVQEFDKTQIEQYGQYYTAALTALTTNPLAPFHSQSLMSDVEHKNWLLAANMDAVSNLSDHTLVSAFTNAAKQYSEKVALSFGNNSLTYTELEAHANRLAHYLKSKGVGSETLVGICLERSQELVVCILAILKAGGAYVPIDVNYPQERIDFILRDSGISLLLTQSSAISQISLSQTESKIEILVLEDIAPQLQNQSSAPVEVTILPEHPAYVIYTSGSTGIPKGCVVTHNNVIRLFKATESWYGFNSNDVWTLFHSYAFDFAVWELWGALLYGGRTVIVPYWTSRSPVDFLKLLQSEKVTVLNQTPSAFKQLVQVDTEAKLNLRYVIFGGEALEVQSLQPWFERYGNQTQLVNMYGITETTVHVTYRPISFSDVKDNCGSVIGQPIFDLKLYILDEYLEPVPVGVPGELYIGGAGVTRGYLHHPRLTAERFIPDIFAKTPNSRLYRSGDLARRLPNGDLEYLGRSDQQVKIRGFRIELGEIEAALMSHPQVKTAFATAYTESAGDARIVAYFVPHQEDDLIIVLRDFLSKKLPDYMMPSALIPLENIPLTPHGKVDRAALPTPNWTQNIKPYVAPRNEVEANICSLMAAVLKLEQVGVMDNFFDMGGDSIRVTQLVTRLQETYKTELPLPYVFQNGTPEGLAKLIEASEPNQTTTSISRVSRKKRVVNLSNEGSI
ncbi:pyoverdine synthetase D [Dulcicalothrix desertica PCC 7102]|uniref:Pyoverdine synthetase D n=1 Tax=Dulcicalothrix desertica PCC 7102 TaxID=232991 RepID=A0A3S1A769_9CYAN|nr:non-ribosomal peptide synthetase [Dulcicalothrix desertica]RUS95011.1 pyoverdine synthetase D [Dulcicalothrix desertica PCC 7102]TWH51413.1 amino acid adenylation domain-containing protein [Dulcicalothrix desertica PCC 7102]